MKKEKHENTFLSFFSFSEKKFETFVQFYCLSSYRNDFVSK